MGSIIGMTEEELNRIATRARAAINDILIDEGITEDERTLFWKAWRTL